MSTDLFHLLQTIQQSLQEQAKKLSVLEQKMQTLNAEVTALKSKPMTIEYKFDQLKVETLEGTLNIGLQPFTNPPDIDQFSLGSAPKPTITPQMTPHFDRELHNEMIHYLDTFGNERISIFEKEHQRSVNETYRNFMLDDIKRQMNLRIPYYLNLFVNSERSSGGSNDPMELKQKILQKMKDDIDAAFIAFIVTLPKQEGAE